MIFSSFEFFGFFLLVLIGRALPRTLSAEKWFLLAASLCFYISWNLPCVILILLMAMSDFTIARHMGATEDAVRRRRLLWLSLVINIGLLVFFKYSNFFLANLSAALHALGANVGRLHIDIIQPPAISYFTFAGLSYVLDVYYQRMEPCTSARDYALFITFFPKLLSGPIVRAREFLPQLRERVRASAEDLEVGVSYFLMGAVKKLVIAEQVSTHVNTIFGSPDKFDGLTLLQGVLGYAVQIYCDFSGYTDMAIGCARVLGFRFPENFQMPFSAASITEFWRRWHMTLSSWFRDYAFLPLEMATRNHPSPILRVSTNMTLMMILVGLWHGASWNFVVFGLIHGVALALHKIWTTRNPLKPFKHLAIVRVGWPVLAHLLTLSLLAATFVLFRAETFGEAVRYLTGIFSWQHGTRMLSPYIIPALAAVVAVHLFIHKDRNWVEEIPQRNLALRFGYHTAILLLLVCLGATEAATFIYIQF